MFPRLAILSFLFFSSTLLTQGAPVSPSGRLAIRQATPDDADINHLHDSTPMQGQGGNVTPFKRGAENVAAQGGGAGKKRAFAGRSSRRNGKTRRTKLVSAVKSKSKRQATPDDADINHLHDSTPMQGKGGNVTPFKGGAENVAAQAAKAKRQAAVDDADVNHLHDSTPMQGKGGNVTPFKGGAENVAAQAAKAKRQAAVDDADVNHLHDSTPMQGKGGNVTPFKGGAENVAAQGAKVKRQATADDADINHLHDSTPMQGKGGNVTPFKGGAENVAAQAAKAKRETEGVNELQAGAGGGATAWKKMSKRQADESDINHFKTSVPTQGKNGVITTFKGTGNAQNAQKRNKFDSARRDARGFIHWEYDESVAGTK